MHMMLKGELEATIEVHGELRQEMQQTCHELRSRAEYAEGYLQGHKLSAANEKKKVAFQLEQMQLEIEG